MNIIDMHAHLFYDRGLEKEKRIILNNIEKYSISETYVSALSSFFPSEEDVKALNASVLSFVLEEPKYIKGYVYVSPEHKNALYVLRQGIEEQKMIGAKIWVSEYCDAQSVNILAERLIEYKLPFLVHAYKKSTEQCAKESTAINVRNLAMRYPELKIIMAHVDGNCYHGVPLIKNLPNVWVDVSGLTARAGEVEYAVENLGDRRVLFGSDASGCSFAIPYGKVLEACISESSRRKILCENAQRLFDGRLGVGEY